MIQSSPAPLIMSGVLDSRASHVAIGTTGAGENNKEIIKIYKEKEMQQLKKKISGFKKSDRPDS
jgi:hypothetical protein